MIATQPRRPLPQIVRHLIRQAVPKATRDENELAAVMAFVRHGSRTHSDYAAVGFDDSAGPSPITA